MTSNAAAENTQHLRSQSALGLVLRAVPCALATLACILAVAAPAARAEGSLLLGSPGEGAGQIGEFPTGLAVDRESGDVYVADGIEGNRRIDKFDSTGAFLLAWGWGVIPAQGSAQGANELEVCTKATGCGRGRGGEGAGEFNGSCGATGIAVDNNGPTDPSNGDVYVVDFCNYRVQKFDPSGKFLLMFGGHVNKNGTDVCVAGEECQAGSSGTEDGEFEWDYRRAYIAVGPGGDVYVGDRARVQIFLPTGAWNENLSLGALSATGRVSALAVNSSGDVYVKDEGVPGIREFEPGGIEMPTRLDEEAGEAPEAISLDASGDLFVSENKPEWYESCRCRFVEYSPSGEEVSSFGADTLDYITSAMTFDDALGKLLVFGFPGQWTEEAGHVGIWGFTLPPPGPVIEPGSEKATPELRGAAMLQATVNPEGSATTVQFQYVDEAHFKSSGYAGAATTAPVSIGTGFADQLAETQLPQKTLVPGVRYHWRALASNTAGNVAGPDESFEEVPPAYVEGPWATHVTGDSATLAAKINPLGANTKYRLEYGLTTSYGHVLSGNVGEGTAFVPVVYHIQELEGQTAYHYRLMTESEVGVVEGADHTFTTQAGAGELLLPDNRAWELVSPADKRGAMIGSVPALENPVPGEQAANNGNAFAYESNEPIAEGTVGRRTITENLARHGTQGWSSRNISAPKVVAPEGGVEDSNVGREQFYVFSPDLSLVAFEPSDLYTELAEGIKERTIFLRNNVNETYIPLVSPANVLPEVKIAGEGRGNEQLGIEGVTPDLSHVFMRSPLRLTADAPPTGSLYNHRIYEWSQGKLGYIGEGDMEAFEGLGTVGMTAHAVSSDGRWVVIKGPNYYRKEYVVVDTTTGQTTPFGGYAPVFQTMSTDGSKVFYLEAEARQRSTNRESTAEQGELYALDPATGAATDLTADHLNGEPNAKVQNTISTSEDGKYVYFVATGVLATGATSGGDNLYLLHESGGQWTTSFIATLSSEDEPDWGPGGSSSFDIRGLESRVSADGRYLTFMSNRSLTGYDNADALTGQRDEEVFVYDAVTQRLVCVSCNPTGARPMGISTAEFAPGNHPLVDRAAAWGKDVEGVDHSLAGVLAPAWYGGGTIGSFQYAAYQARDLFDDGRLFFNSTDALVPQDINGVADVYEYEPAGVGSCTSASTTFSATSGGCVSLISSGQSGEEAVFSDASETGDDAFFITSAKLAPQDYDNAYDVYDAHVCGVGWSCQAAPVSPPPCTSGDSCKAAPTPQPLLFGAGASETFNGTGNVAPHRGAQTNPKHAACARGKVRDKRGRCVRKRRGKRRKGKRARTRTTTRAMRRGSR